MNAKRGAPEPTPIRDVKHFESLLELSETKVVIVDLHQDWCGPATAMTPFYNSLWLETENAGNRIQLASMELGKDKELEKIVQKGCEVKLSATCKPCFVLLRNGAIVGTIDGLNTGVMSMLLEIHVPKLPKKAE